MCRGGQDKQCHIDRDKLEILLLTDEHFVDTFNIFLALPVFGIRLFYNKTARTFEQHEHINKSPNLATIFDAHLDYTEHGQYDTVDGTPHGASTFLKVLNPANCLDIIERHRLPLFNRSTLYFQYVLASELCRRSQDKVLLNRNDVFEFVNHLKGSIGYNVYSCWMDLTRATHNVMNLVFDKYFVGYLRRVYFSPSSLNQIPSICFSSYRRVDHVTMSHLLQAELVDELLDYWKDRYKAHVSFIHLNCNTFVTQRHNSLVGAELLDNADDLLVRVPLEWRRYKLPSRYKHNPIPDNFILNKKDALLRTISLEKQSGGYLWETLLKNQSSLGVQRCLILLYFVQIWLEFSVPAIMEKKKITYQLTDYIYFSSVHITGDQWIGCPSHVREAVCCLLKTRTGNLNSFKSAVDFSLSYILRPFLRAFKSDMELIVQEVRVDGEWELRQRLTAAAVKETIFMKINPKKEVIEKACREVLSLKDVSRRGILNILDKDDWLSEIICRKFVV